MATRKKSGTKKKGAKRRAVKDEALALPTETGFAIMDEPEAREMMLTTFDELGISNFQLARLKIPAGGSTAFMVETLEGDKPMQEIEAVIVTIKGQQKSWWRETMETSTGQAPPDCSSTDGKTGFGVNTLGEDEENGKHNCLECVWNQFGSHRGGGKGKDCKDSAHIFLFQSDGRLPTLLSAPATSLPVVQKYVMTLLNAGKGVESVVTKIGLEAVKGGGGGVYSRLTLNYGGDLDGEAAATMHDLGKDLRSRLGSFDAYADSSD
jgi:hypothetical protein